MNDMIYALHGIHPCIAFRGIHECVWCLCVSVGDRSIMKCNNNNNQNRQLVTSFRKCVFQFLASVHAYENGRVIF